MRLAILSDVHGNLVALEAVLSDLDAQGPFDGLGVAGDLCEWGPQPRETLDRVRGLGCPVVMGNTDRNVVIADAGTLRAMGKSENAIANLAWTREQIGPDGCAYLAALPFAHVFDGPDGHDVVMAHANLRDMDTHLDPAAEPPEAARLLVATGAAVVAFGHLHTPYVRTLERAGRAPVVLVDVSSAGYPRDGDRRAAYAILTWDGGWQATIRRVDYDLGATADAFRASGQPRPEKRVQELYAATYD